jgi:hypothetical protein
MGFWQHSGPQRKKPTKPDHGPFVYENFDEGWSVYEEPETVIQ